MNVFVTDLTADMLWLTCRDFQVDFMVNHHILIISMHINCPHVRGPLCEGLKPPLESFSRIDHAVIVMSNNY